MDTNKRKKGLGKGTACKIKPLKFLDNIHLTPVKHHK
jgi:hypothetical protein